ncbi:MAG: tetratricopeptide repeat protein [Chloroflexi bacterium]|nr:tetratricopeptide repeat protein [Chloroflexota bacterium]
MVQQLKLEFLTKVLPPRAKTDILHRQRLLDFLYENINLKVQLVTAPAGYGKTTLLADFANDAEIPVCWYSLDESDHDPRVFFDTLLTSIRYRFPDFGHNAEARLRASADCVREAAQIIGVMTGEMYTDIPDFFVLVLEDYHAVEFDGTINLLLDLLIERAPDNCHFIISSRSASGLAALARLRMKREVAELSGETLGFTPPEVKQLLADHYRTRLSDEEAERLTASAEGWIAGVLLGASKGRRLPEARSQLTPDDVFNYLASEVYERQPSEIKGFLLLSSTFREIAPEYCDLLFKLNNSAALLDRIEKRSLFITRLQGDRRMYRYHALFRDFLQDKLRREQPETYALLHRDAGGIFEEQKQWNQAIDQYLAANAHADALRIIKANAESYLKAGRWQTLSRWIQALPDSLRVSEPTLSLFEAESLVHVGHVDRAMQVLNGLLGRLVRDEDWLLRAKALSWRSAAYRLTGHYDEALQDARSAIRLLRRNNGPPSELGEAYRRLGNIHIEEGQFLQAVKCLRRSLRLFVAVFDVNQIAAVHNSLGVVFKRRGDLLQAMTHYKRATEYWGKSENVGALALTLNNLGVLYHRRGEYDLALETFNAGLGKARSAGYVRSEAIICNSLADVQRDLGRYDDAFSNYSRAIELAGQALEPYRATVATAGIGVTYGLRGELDKAESLLREAIVEAEERRQDYDVGQFTLRLGVIRCQQGRYSEAEKLLVGVYRQMERLGDKDAVARCAMHLAQVSYLSGKRSSTLDWLGKVSDLVGELGYDEFLVVEARGMLDLLQYGASRRIAGDLYERAINRIRERANSDRMLPVVTEPLDTGIDSSAQIKALALGEATVFANSKLVPESAWRSAKAKEMFFFLLCCNGRANKEQILGSLWPDVSPAKGKSLIHSNLYRLRRALFDSVVLNRDGAYGVNPAVTVWFDLRQFEDYLASGRKKVAPDQDKVACLETAIDMYKGPFLRDLYSDWVETRRRDLEEQYLHGLTSLADIYERTGRHSDAIGALEKSIATDPYSSDAYYDLARCYLATGDRSSALRVCKRYKDLSRDEGLPGPSSKMEELVRSVRSAERVAAL